MYKNPIFIFFLIATFIILQPFILSPENAFRDNRGFVWTINFLFSSFWYNYIPVLILMFVKLLRELLRKEVIQKILKVLNIICIVIITLYYIFIEFISLCADFAFRDW